MNAIAQLEFELIHYNIAVQHISHYTTVTSPPIFVSICKMLIVDILYRMLVGLKKKKKKKKKKKWPLSRYILRAYENYLGIADIHEEFLY